MNELFIYLNILTLLKKEPKRFEDLWESGFFRREQELRMALYHLEQANCIEKLRIKDSDYYVILAMGWKFLEFYSDHELRMSSLKLQHEGIIVPIGRQS